MPNGKQLTNMGAINLQKPGLHSDGNGLYLRVSNSYDPNGDRKAHKGWVFRYSHNGKEHRMGLGPLKDVSLAEAREHAAECRKQLRQGIDPILERRNEKARRASEQAQVMTFEACARQYIAAHRGGWKNAKHAQQWENTLQHYVFGEIGNLPIDVVNAHHVKTILDKIWFEKTETASRVRSRMENILDWAASLDLRSPDNPAAWNRMKHHFPSKNKIQKTKSFKALPFEQMYEFMQQLEAKNTEAAQALKFTILTASRTSEVREAIFDEFDLVERVWTIPADRMKAAREHRVPLTTAAIDIVEARKLVATSHYVFPGRNGKTPMSNMAMLKMLQQDMKVDATVHGFRSCFSDWARERTNYQRDVVEMALAHSIRDKTEAAYRRGDLLDKRRRLMEDWAIFCETVPATGSVTAIRSPISG